MKYAFLIYITIICIILSGCKEDSCSSLSGFSGITERDDFGKLIKTDENDWTLKDHWSSAESGLFEKAYRTDCVPPSSFAITAHPNPTNGPFQVNFSKTDYTKVDLRLVDSNCNIILSHDNIQSNTLGMQAGGVKDGVVRLYYKFVEDGCEYEGHGDIKLETNN